MGGKETMEYTKLGNSELKRFPESVWAAWASGNSGSSGQHSWTLDEEQSRKLIRRALELGVNFFDTAIGHQGGTSEEYLGRSLRDCAKREDVVVAN